MPRSCKCILDRMVFKGAMTEEERDKIVRNLKMEWAPVTERLPEKNMRCLLTVGKFHLIQIGTYSDLMGTINHKIFWRGEYGKNSFENITEYVIAWMPLPKPYEEGEEND